MLNPLNRIWIARTPLFLAAAFLMIAGGTVAEPLPQGRPDTLAALDFKTPPEEISPWDWGFRFRVRETYIVNPFDLSYDNFDDWHFFRFRSQLWGSYAPNEWWKVHAMLNNEFRRWMKPEDGPRGDGFTWDEVIFESLYIEGMGLNYSPYGFKVGRQNLFYGEGLIC